MEHIYCPIRKQYVASLPEERVRQKLLSFMINQLNFPLGYIAVEKELRTLPHLLHSSLEIPDRRADVICFGKDIHSEYSLFPLLLVECKAVPLTQKVIQQVTGYNHCVQAAYVCIVNETEIKTGWYSPSKKAYEFIDHLPFYKDLYTKK